MEEISSGCEAATSCSPGAHGEGSRPGDILSAYPRVATQGAIKGRVKPYDLDRPTYFLNFTLHVRYPNHSQTQNGTTLEGTGRSHRALQLGQHLLRLWLPPSHSISADSRGPHVVMWSLLQIRVPESTPKQTVCDTNQNAEPGLAKY